MRRGTRVGQAYVSVAVDGDGINEDIVDSVDEAGPGVEEAGRRHGRRYGDNFSEGFLSRIRTKIGKSLSRDMGDIGDEGGRSFVDRFEDHFDRDFMDRLGAHVGGHFVDALNFAMSKEGGENPLSRLFDRWVDEEVSGNGGRSNKRSQKMGIVIGRLFGAGSRNNFLNILGKSMAGVVNGFEAMFSGLRKVGPLVSNFSANMAKAGEGASLLQRLGAGFTGSAEGFGLLSKLSASGPAAAVAITAVVVSLSAFMSVIGALIGLVTALAATITSALVGALAVLGGALAAVTAGAGLLTAAFTSMTDAQQAALKNAFIPLKEEMVGIGQIMLRDMVPAFGTWSANLQRALLIAVPVADRMGAAFARAGNIITNSLSGPGFQMFAQSLATYLPSITTRLARALGDFLNGLTGMFAALMPYVNQFAGYLARVANEFARWATSAQGQNAISDFVGRAVTSLQSLWDFVSSFSGFLAEVLFSPEAQNAGNTIFDALARTFDRFSRKVSEASANGDLKRWFDDAIRFGGQLWGVIEALAGTFMALYNSGVLSAVGKGLEALATTIDLVNRVATPMVNIIGVTLPKTLSVALAPLQLVGNTVGWLADKFGFATQRAYTFGSTIASFGKNLGASVMQNVQMLTAGVGLPDLGSLIQMGNTALANTSIDRGGYKPKGKWKNPWKKWAESLIKDGPSIAAQIRNAVLTVNKQVAKAIVDASRSSDSSSVQASLENMASSMTTTAEQTVNSAQSALNTAASSLANATSKKAAKRALKEVRRSQRNLRAALRNQVRINNAAKILNAQQVVSEPRVLNLISGIRVNNATLADYAEARSRVADMLDDANQKLQAAVQMRDEYKNQVAESIRSFGSLLSTQARTIDGVEQALTHSDITANLEDRLAKIKAFQNNLRLLLAQGLSNDAYKQIVDAGVEQGSTLAEALLGGGSGAIQNVNSLVGQINGIADTLGTETSNRMYQAGVDAAQGLVDGLTSLSAKLDAAAVSLGNSIAAAVKRALGINSPSRVLFDMMGYVGDGIAGGLDAQHTKVGLAANRLSGQIAVTPAAAVAQGDGRSEVSGNSKPGWVWNGNIVTPTKDPHAVATEVLNELTGRL